MKKVILLLIFALHINPLFAEEKAKTGADPTDFITRVEPSYEFREKTNGDTINSFVVRGDLALKRNYVFE